MAQLTIFPTLRYLAFVLFVALVSANVMAATASIAFLDEQTAILDTERAKAFRKELEDELKSEIQDVRQINAELQSLQEKITKDRDIMSNEERQRLVNDVRAKNVKGENLAESIREIQQQRLQMLFQEMNNDLTKVVGAIIELENYDAVFRYTPQNIIFVNKDYDITARVTEGLNAKLAKN